MEKHWDAIVIGGGPAGSTVARYAAQEGVKVLVIDSRNKIGSPLQCGELVPTNDQLRKLCPDVPDIDDAFYFFDPPYRDSFADYGNSFGDEQLIELIDFPEILIFLFNKFLNNAICILSIIICNGCSDQ